MCDDPHKTIIQRVHMMTCWTLRSCKEVCSSLRRLLVDRKFFQGNLCLVPEVTFLYSLESGAGIVMIWVERVGFGPSPSFTQRLRDSSHVWEWCIPNLLPSPPDSHSSNITDRARRGWLWPKEPNQRPKEKRRPIGNVTCHVNKSLLLWVCWSVVCGCYRGGCNLRTTFFQGSTYSFQTTCSCTGLFNILLKLQLPLSQKHTARVGSVSQDGARQ